MNQNMQAEIDRINGELRAARVEIERLTRELTVTQLERANHIRRWNIARDEIDRLCTKIKEMSK